MKAVIQRALFLAVAAAVTSGCAVSTMSVRENNPRQAAQSVNQPKAVAACMERNAQSKFRLKGTVVKGAAPLDLVFSAYDLVGNLSHATVVADIKSEDGGSRIGIFVSKLAGAPDKFAAALVEGC